MEKLTAKYSNTAQGGSSWLRIYQEPISETAQQVSYDDLAAMYYMALAKVSARLYESQSCPVSMGGGVIEVPVPFYIFPSSLELAYQLSSGVGEVDRGIATQVWREFDLIVDNESEVDLGFLAETVEWIPLTGYYDHLSRPLRQAPTITHQGGKLLIEPACFCILRVKCLALGFAHTLTMQLDKFEEKTNADGELNWSGYKLDNLQSVVQATWFENGELQSTSKKLAIPPCVKDFLSFCPDDSERAGEPVSYVGSLKGHHTILWYSTCTGRELAVRRVRDE